jgi:hypothetical protein
MMQIASRGQENESDPSDRKAYSPLGNADILAHGFWKALSDDVFQRLHQRRTSAELEYHIFRFEFSVEQSRS